MKKKLFIGILLPNEISDQILQLQKRLSAKPLNIKWVEKQKMHLNLNFIGNIEESRISGLQKKIDDYIRQIAPFRISPDFIEVLYKRHEESLIYLGLGSGTAEIKSLQKVLCKMLETLQLPQQTKFLPHITIGLCPRTDPTTTKRTLDEVRQIAGDSSGIDSLLIDKVSVIQSIESKTGSYFQKLADISFSVE